jgi:hypothetical protein
VEVVLGSEITGHSAALAVGPHPVSQAVALQPGQRRIHLPDVEYTCPMLSAA